MAEPVCIAIPAYSERYFPEAFASALAQRYAPLEILVCDDSPGTAIEATVRAASDPRVRYVRNPGTLGFAGNFTKCFREARADLLKFLNDDDRLLPACVESLASVLEANPGVRLATSRRRVIGAQGEALADVPATSPVSLLSALVFGRELGDLALVNSMNVIGEPTTVMFRRSHLPIEDDSVFRWGGHEYHCLADMSIWLRLLSSGLAYYCASPLSEYRRHEGQEQRRPGARLECTVERLWIVREARRAGFLAAEGAWRRALEAILAPVEAAIASAAIDPQARAPLTRFADEVRAQIAAAGGESPRL
ncbi:MAG TPA: glycosyltransferase [Usitatibacter sp.]|nr:glycosyltransferase [Usitatibacter sp.]